LWLPIELSPVDDTAKAIVMLAQRYDGIRIVFHLYNDKPVRFKHLIKALKSTGIKMKAVSTKKFLHVIGKTVKCPEKSHVYEAFINDFDTDGNLHYQSNITLKSNQTIRHLKEIGFTWLKTDSSYLRSYADYFRDIGYFGGTTDE